MDQGRELNTGALEQTSSWGMRIDRAVGLLKWPAAWLATLVTPLLFWSLLLLLLRVISSPFGMVPFVGGALGFLVLWRRYLRSNSSGKFLITLEHESTHALFALLTFHRIVSFRATFGEGGEVLYQGKGNWLITAAPYFFPTLALILFLVAYILPFPGLPWQSFLLGVAFAYHIVSTIRETNRDQSDVKELGLTFCWMFLPAANLAVVGLLISFAHNSSDGLSLWFSDILAPIRSLLSLPFTTSTGSFTDGV